jgi:hypothetical protein
MLIGNHSKTNPILFETNAVPYNQRITCTPSPIYPDTLDFQPSLRDWVVISNPTQD